MSGVGDGLTGTGVGALQRFRVPANATRLFLGFIDGNCFGWPNRATPGSYSDNSGSLSVSYNLSGPPPGQLIIPAGTTTATVRVAVVDDDVPEGDETVFVAMGPATNATLGTQTTHEVTILANDTCVVPAAELISWWRAENNASDSIGLNHGTLQNGATFVPGRVNQAFSFAGSTDRVFIPNNSNIDFKTASEYTIELWMKAGSNSNLGPALVEKWAGSGSYPYVLRMQSSQAATNPGRVYAAAYDGTNNPAAVSASRVDDNQWPESSKLTAHFDR